MEPLDNPKALRPQISRFSAQRPYYVGALGHLEPLDKTSGASPDPAGAPPATSGG